MPDDPRAGAEADLLGRWCVEHLGSPPVEEIFRSGHLSVVIGLRLADHREVTIKIRQPSPRIAACVQVQRRVFEAGFPCPQPLTGALAFGDHVATAETYVAGGDPLPSSDRTAAPFAETYHRLIESAPGPDEVMTLDPPPSWADWDHGGDGLWPQPAEDPDIDLNAVTGAEWLDDVGRRARDRLRAGGSKSVIGHGDWIADNLRWRGDTLLVLHDWDSMMVDSEAVLVGFAAALYPAGDVGQQAGVGDTDQFLAAYCRARGGDFSADELQRSWAAGVWTRAYDAKYQHGAGLPISSLSDREAGERLRRAGA